MHVIRTNERITPTLQSLLHVLILPITVQDRRVAQEDYSNVACTSGGSVEDEFNYLVRSTLAQFG